MASTRFKATLPLAALVLGMALLVLSGCSGSAGGSGAASSNGTPAATAQATVSGGITTTNTPLPASIPPPPNATLTNEYTGQLNGHSATIWDYTINSSAQTPQAIAAMYEKEMPQNAWQSAAVPTVTPQAGISGNRSILAFQQRNQVALIASGYANGSSSGPVAVIITVGG
jgi:hypothetical protein